ncbi:MAG: hypothetical protein KC501_20560 [Myxococcales bacterium]|nr:hypothetical protein [Myxococcales bacterium]
MNFPKLRRIALSHFSLYSHETEVDEEQREGVFCLAGANGLGKSTFLAAANYAITGVVPEPERKFKSVKEYYQHSLAFAYDYFTGRIEESDRESASVLVELDVGRYRFKLTRGLFEQKELRELTVLGREDPNSIVFDGSDIDGVERHEQYIKMITEDIGVSSFEQFTFLQHFVLTFDERRHLLFWNPKVLEQALFLAFGLDNSLATRADSLRRDEERADSRVRNTQWQATQARNRMKDLKATAENLSSSGDDDESVFDQYEVLNKKSEAVKRKSLSLEDQLRDATLKFAELSAEQVSLRTQYREEFSKRLSEGSKLAHHPIIAASIADKQCGLCGSEGSEVAKEITTRVNAADCPLCGSELPKGPRNTKKKLETLKKLDKSLAENKSKTEQRALEIERLKKHLETTYGQKAELDKAIRELEKRNRALLREVLDVKKGGIAEVLKAYVEQIEKLEKEKKAHIKERDAKRRELKALQKKLESAYAEAEEVFVPQFRTLAGEFIGLDLDVEMQNTASTGTTLILKVQGTPRREQHQLSESQRFFIDIALRMALVQFMSNPAADGATLYIDTPEGSLDIAYEARAGSMLAKFVESGFDVFMTANINTSQLLLELASRLRANRMRLCRMTSWAELSEVQVAEEHLFDRAYEAIETALGKKRNKKTTPKKTSKKRTARSRKAKAP